MAENKAVTFEVALKRLEEIVRSLEGEGVTLDRSVELFQEGRELARRCDQLLKTAQETIDAAIAIPPVASKSAGTANVESFDNRLDDELQF